MDNTKTYVVPGSPGLIVRDPTNYNTIVPEKGMIVPIIGAVGRYWRKKIKTGEVKVSKPPKVEVKSEIKQRKREDS